MTTSDSIRKFVAQLEANHALNSVIVIKQNRTSVRITTTDSHAVSACQGWANRYGSKQTTSPAPDVHIFHF